MHVNLLAQGLPCDCAQQELSFYMRSVDRIQHMQRLEGGLVSENSVYSSALATIIKYTDWWWGGAGETAELGWLTVLET